MSDRTVRMPRAVRRHHRQRLSKKRRFHWGLDMSLESEKRRGMIINTPTPCSCHGCGNPRKYKDSPYHGLTMQEIRCIIGFKLDGFDY